MKKYILKDDEGWLSTLLYDTIDEAMEQAERLLKKPAWENASHLTILEINTRTRRCDDYKTVFK